MAERHSIEATKAGAIELEYATIANGSSEEKMEQSAPSGDEALKVLHTNIEYTEAEEKAVQRKIDWRLIPIMLTVNSLQLIDKGVCLVPLFRLWMITNNQISEYITGSDIWPHSTGQTQGARVQPFGSVILHWIFGCGISNQLSHAKVPDWQIPDS